MTHTAFEPVSLAGIKLKNRIIRSATYEAMADEKGFPTEKLKKLYINLAKGNAGAIITGNAGVQANGKASLFTMTMIDNDDKISAYREITDAVHEYDTPIIMQIVHCGRQTRSKITGLPTVAPSAIRDGFYSEDKPKELSDNEINEVIDNFVAAIVRTKQAGFDGVQVHLAHGYLLAEFLSSHTNRRKDRWGGSTENKYRIIGEIFKRAKELVGDYPILVKMNAHDGRRNGMRIEEAACIAQMLEKSGCAAIEVSCGCFEDNLYTIRSEKLPAEAAMKYTFKFKKLPGFIKAIAIPIAKTFIIQPKPLLKYNLDAAIQIKKAVSIPVIVVGGINNIDDINDIIGKSKIDFVSMCRPFIIEPDIVSKFKKGTQAKSKCIMCNHCAVMLEVQPLQCHYGRLPKTKS
ncbi:MAG: NADH:flavin oxidoreductase [Deltaproteobacteria bacterium HGW-Deltaproteobacteria-13]|jgi:2,4-dienoyl-CoA reductase-like NADH-dependent reductase (Old Yellow Enzyme family)|nr:MAG: NADH:flavin oxidoreductase [Deltaproteobacteria bacterium HGW-Deltaproteobacteria-13]